MNSIYRERLKIVANVFVEQEIFKDFDEAYTRLCSDFEKGYPNKRFVDDFIKAIENKKYIRVSLDNAGTYGFLAGADESTVESILSDFHAGRINWRDHATPIIRFKELNPSIKNLDFNDPMEP